MMTREGCKAATWEHISRVTALLLNSAFEVARRGVFHDSSKLEEPELSTFQRVTPKLKELTYGSEEYKKMLAEMKPALDHHYAKNRHHPEHHELGVCAMTLVDLVEMLMDWKAASERHTDGDIHRSIQQNMERFGFTAELAAILENTALEMWGE